MARGGRESLRPTYSQPKLTLVSTKKSGPKGGVTKYNLENPLRRISLKDVSFGLTIFSYGSFGSRFFFETRVNFGWL